MIQAELLRDELKPRQTQNGDEIRVAHIGTRHGITAVRSVFPPNPTDELFIAGGLGSGANYERLVNRAVESGFIARTVRHGNDSFNQAIDAGADEFAASIEQLAKGPVHIIAHSKGARVAIKAAARLDRSIDLKTLSLINPALNKSKIKISPGNFIGVAWEQLACLGKLQKAASGVFHEITHRGLGILGEVRELLKTDDTLITDFKSLALRGVRSSLAGGSFDHIVPAENITTDMWHEHFDEVTSTDGYMNGSHFAVLASDEFVRSILPRTF